MQKTRKSVAKRFKVTGSGKLVRRKPGHRHLLRNKSQKQLNAMGKDQSVSKGFTEMYKQAMPHS
jgi:large subunit ribosomal protein L35